MRTGERPAPAPTEAASAATARPAQPHLVHTGAGPYGCLGCGAAFAHMSFLLEHQKSHTGEKPFRCGAAARPPAKARRSRRTGARTPHSGSRASLTQHHGVHTGLWPYECDGCGKAFSFSALIRHQKRHASQQDAPGARSVRQHLRPVATPHPAPELARRREAC